MSHITLGIDIKSCGLRYALCEFTGGQNQAELIATEIIKAEPTGDKDALDDVFAKLNSRLDDFKKYQIDGVGLSLDPTLVLSAHCTLPFNDPKMIEKVLPQDLMETWKLDTTPQIAFQVGDFVKGKEAEEDGEESASGYDILAINYPFATLSELLNRFRNTRLDPHVALPSIYALPYAMGTFLRPAQICFAILEIGDKISTISIVLEKKVILTRPLKVGSSNIDESLSQIFGIAVEQARVMKESTGFVAIPGTEATTYNDYVAKNFIQPWEVDPATLSNGCIHGLDPIISALRQSVISFASKHRLEPECIYISGGGAKLCGLDSWLAQVAGVPCYKGLPISIEMKSSNPMAEEIAMDIDAVAIAAAAAANLEKACPLNLRRGQLSHKGSLAFIQDNKWLIASIVVGLIIALIFMTSTRATAVKTEHDKVKQALEQTTNDLFGKKLLNYNQIEKEIASSEGFDFLPVRTAFTHFEWISNNVNDNLSDIEMDFSSLDIDTQRKIVTIKGEVSGDEGLTRFLQLLEQYECFPNEILEPKTNKVKERTSFTLRVDANHCAMGGVSE